jgi:predicted DNA-binding protein with PD1-like motif
MGRVPEGADLLAYVAEAARRHGVRLGRIGVIGSVREAVLWYLDQAERQYRPLRFEGGLEIAAALGNVSLKDGEPFCHLHAVLSDREGRAVAGHVAPGTVVFTAEYWLEEVEGPPLVRVHDPRFNLPLWGGPEA